MENKELVILCKCPDSDFEGVFAHIFNAIAFADIKSKQVGRSLMSLRKDRIVDIILVLSDVMYFVDGGYDYAKEKYLETPSKIRPYFETWVEVYVGDEAEDILMMPKCPFNYYALDMRLPENERFITGES